MRTFRDKYLAASARNGSSLCVGLDASTISLRALDAGVELLDIAKDTYQAAAAFKVNMAPWISCGPKGVSALKTFLKYLREWDIPIILDAKYADVRPMMAHYAGAAFGEFEADAVTVIPYMGLDTIAPFYAWVHRHTFVVLRSSNPDGKHIQNRVYQYIAHGLMGRDNVGFVVGAGELDAIEYIREDSEDVMLLMPGVGAQGADPVAAAKAAKCNFLISASRSLVKDSEHAAKQLRLTINKAVGAE